MTARRRTLADERPLLGWGIAALVLCAALFLLYGEGLPWVDHLSALAAAATRNWMAGR